MVEWVREGREIPGQYGFRGSYPVNDRIGVLRMAKTPGSLPQVQQLGDQA